LQGSENGRVVTIAIPPISINNTNNHLSHLKSFSWNTKKDQDMWKCKSDSSLGQAQKCGRVKPVKWDPKNA
jgi:hypothetical protein